jgi:protein deglycase
MNALIILADGFEEIEAVSVIDILWRGGVTVTIAGLDRELVAGANSIVITADTVLSAVLDQDYDAVILPGGEPGTTNLQNSDLVLDIISRHFRQGWVVAAICAAPRIFAAMGILNGKKATSYPATKKAMVNCDYSEELVVVDGNVLTSRGPGTAMLFGYTILERLGLTDMSIKLKQGMVFS